MPCRALGLITNGVPPVANRFETIAVPYPAHVVMRGARKEHPALLMVQAPVRLASGPTPDLLAEVKMPGARPPQSSLPFAETPGWLGEPWRYYEHPDTGQLLTDWRASIREPSNSGGITAHRSAMSFQDVSAHLGFALDADLANDARLRMVGPAFNPFVSNKLWIRWTQEEGYLICPEATEFRSSRVETGVRDEALATAAKLAREFFVTDDGRLLVPTQAPRWMLGASEQNGRNWMMPWPGQMGGMDEGWGWSNSTVPADRPDLGFAFRQFSNESFTRYGSLVVATGFSPEPELPAEFLRKTVNMLSLVTSMDSARPYLETAQLPDGSGTGVRDRLEAIVAVNDELTSWLEGPRDPALLIDPLARLGHRIHNFIEAVAALPAYSQLPYSDPRVGGLQSLKLYAIGMKPRENEEIDRVLRIVSGITGLDLPASWRDLQNPDAEAVQGPAPDPGRHQVL